MKLRNADERGFCITAEHDAEQIRRGADEYLTNRNCGGSGRQICTKLGANPGFFLTNTFAGHLREWSIQVETRSPMESSVGYEKQFIPFSQPAFRSSVQFLRNQRPRKSRRNSFVDQRHDRRSPSCPDDKPVRSSAFASCIIVREPTQLCDFELPLHLEMRSIASFSLDLATVL
jgi:hypothetical protein